MTFYVKGHFVQIASAQFLVYYSYVGRLSRKIRQVENMSQFSSYSYPDIFWFSETEIWIISS